MTSKPVLGLAILAVIISAAALAESFSVMQQLNQQSTRVDDISSKLSSLSDQLSSMPTTPATGTKTIYMVILADMGGEGYDKFVPATAIVQKGDTIKIVLNNTDEMDHGFAIDALGINKVVKAGETIAIEFVANQAGVFEFYCTIPCGEGHSQMTGQLVVLG